MTWSYQWTTLTLREDGNEAETKTRGSSYRTLKVRMDPWIKREDCKEAKKTCDRLHREHAAAAGCVNARIYPQKSNSTRTGTTIRRTRRWFFIVLIEKSDGDLFSCNHHEFSFFIILVATIRQMVDSMELGLFIMEWAMDFFRSRCENSRLQQIAIPLQATEWYTERLVARIFSHAHSLSSGVVKKSIITHFTCICMAQDEAVCIFQNKSCFAQQVVHYTWVDQHLSHFALAFLPILRHDLPQLPQPSIPARLILATIHNKRVSAWLTYARLQVMIPRILQKTMICVSKPLFFHRPSITSTCDSAESIATPPPESDQDDEQIRALLAWPPFLQERIKCGPITSLSLCKRKPGVKFISSSEEYGETRRVFFSSKRKSSQEALSDRRFFLRTSTGSRKQRTSVSDSLVQKIR